MISIILNTHNRKETTIKYLPKIIQSCGEETQVLINDNASDDGLQDWLKEAPFEIDILQLQKENIGVPAGLNQLLPYCEGEYIAKVDPDFIMPDNWGTEAIKILKDKSIGLVGFFWARGLTHPDLQKGAIEKLGENIIFEPTKVFGVWVFRRELLFEVGMFYDQVKYGNWDSEFNTRLKKKGYRNVYHRFDSIHAGTDTPEQRKEKDALRANVEIPELETYKLDEFRELVKRTD